MTDDAVLEGFLIHLRVDKSRSPRTLEAYEATISELRLFVLAGGNRRPLVSLNKDDLRGFLRGSCARPDGTTSSSSWNKRLSALRALYRWLFREEQIQSNPAELLDRQQEKPAEKMPLSIADLVLLVAEVECSSRSSNKARNVAIVKMLIHTGMRISELIGLDVGQLDLERGIIHSLKVKGDKSIVSLLNEVVVQALRAYLGERGQPQKNEPLFVSQRGNRLGRRIVYRKIRQAGETIGFPQRITPHLLRHSHATALAELEIPIATIQAILGHSSSSTTARYVHLGTAQRRKASSALAKLWQDHQEQPP